MLSFYDPLDVNDPEAFIAGIVTLFAQYPVELMNLAADPARGVPARIKVPRSIAAIKEVCDALYEPIAMRLTREAIARQPRALPAPPRTAEEQARIDAQVARVRAQFGLQAEGGMISVDSLTAGTKH